MGPLLFATWITVPFSAFGFANGPVVSANQSAGFFIPLYAQVRRMELVLHAHALGDGPAPPLEVDADGTPLYIGRARDVRVEVPLPPPPRSGVQIVLRTTAGPCSSQAAPEIAIARGSGVVVQTASRGNVPLSAFMNSYAGRVNVILPPHPSLSTWQAALRAAYFLHQSARWRSWSIRLARSPVAGDLNVVLDSFARSERFQDQTLFANAAGLNDLSLDASELYAGSQIADGGAGVPPRELSLDDLGMGDAAAGPSEASSFYIPLQLGAIGGLPQDLHLHLRVAHSDLPAAGAWLDVAINGVTVNSFSLLRQSGTETFDVPIDDDLLSGANGIRVTPHFPGISMCGARARSLHLAMLNTSYFTWSSVRPWAPTVGDFLANASGSLVVMFDDPRQLPAAFAMLDKLGAVNTWIRRIDLRRYDPGLLSQYDYALLALNSTRAAQMRLRARARRLPFGAYIRLSTADARVPALVLSAVRPAEVQTAFSSLPAQMLTREPSDDFAVAGDGSTYAGPRDTHTHTHLHDAIRASMSSVATAFALSLAIGVSFITYRRTHS